jgi:hypothetical protein
MLPTRARRLSALKLTAEIGGVVDPVVGKTDTFEGICSLDKLIL